MLAWFAGVAASPADLLTTSGQSGVHLLGPLPVVVVMRVRTRVLLATAAVLALGATVAVANQGGAHDAARPDPTSDGPHVLAFSQTLGYRHPSIEHAKQVLRGLAEKGGFTIDFTEDPLALSAATLAGTDVVLWLSNTAAKDRSSPFTDLQEAAYARWMTCGGAHVAVHAALDAYDDKAFPAYVEANGAIFATHPPGEPVVRVLVTDRSTPMTAPWKGQWSFALREEIYRLDRDPARGVKDFRLLRAFGGSTEAAARSTLPVRAPIAWTGSYKGKNRTVYQNLGHRSATGDDPAFQRHLVSGITWAAQRRPAPTCLAAPQ
jgi:type 1 glutamine amidotransferase